MTEWTADKFRFPIVKLPPSVATSPDAVINFLAQCLVTFGQLHPAQAARVLEQVLRRESLGSTGCGKGMAFPHTVIDGVKSLTGVIGRCPTGIPWPNAVDDKPVQMVCLLIGSMWEQGSYKEYLEALEAVARQAREHAE